MLVADVVVVGAGLAGSRMCALLRSAGHSGRLTLLGAEPDPPYDRPPLTKDPEAEVDLRAAMDVDVWADADEVLLGVRATRLLARPARAAGAPEPLVVECSDGVERTARAVVLATGADPVLPEGWSRPGVFVLHSRAQARAVWSAIGPGRDVVIIGGGWIGCEAASTASSRGARVVLRESGPSVLAGRVPEGVAARVARWLVDAGVTLSVGDEVASVDAGSAGTAIEGHPADVVLVALGVRPATGWLSDSGLEVSAEGAVLVDPVGRASVPGVFAVGDCAARWSPRRGAHLPGGHWTEALNAPERVAPAVVQWLAEGPGGHPWDRTRARPALPDSGPADPIPYVFSEIAGRTLLLLGAPESGRVVWREAPGIAPGSRQVPSVSEEAWTAFSIDSADRLVGLCTVGRPRDLVAARRAMLAHPSGTPTTDPAALADPTAAPTAMFPGEP